MVQFIIDYYYQDDLFNDGYKCHHAEDSEMVILFNNTNYSLGIFGKIAKFTRI